MRADWCTQAGWILQNSLRWPHKRKANYIKLSTVKHNILDIFFDNGKRSGLHTPPSRTSSRTTVWCFTVNVIPSPKSCQMGVMCREHCMISHILMRTEYNKPLPSCGKYSTGTFDPITYTLNFNKFRLLLFNFKFIDLSGAWIFSKNFSLWFLNY
jgi:hypothetical protein